MYTHNTIRKTRSCVNTLHLLGYLLPPYSQNGTVPSFCARYGGLKEYLYSKRLCAIEFTELNASPFNCLIKKFIINRKESVLNEILHVKPVAAIVII